MSLDSLLAEEAELVARFIECLAQESSVLSQDKVHDLQLITDQKNLLIAELVGAADRRNALLRNAGLPDSAEGLKTWMALHALPDTQKVFDLLKSRSTQAKQLNETNANLVNVRLQATQQALAILLPQEQTPTLYDLQGQSSLRSGNFKFIDSA
ncbi:MAG: hypothetical protein RIR18_1145 [Pseudomonadota bacterium]|jgi:flagellar biosynthesis/type III secretory pathway chaperone